LYFGAALARNFPALGVFALRRRRPQNGVWPTVALDIPIISGAGIFCRRRRFRAGCGNNSKKYKKVKKVISSIAKEIQLL
jgi:hypothetical protein